MQYKIIAEKLNNRAKKFGILNKVHFLSGDFIDVTVKQLKRYAPFSKVAILATEKSFINCAVCLTAQLKKHSFRPTGVVLEKPKRLSAEEVAILFNLSEDVRAVIVTDTDLIEIGIYFATLKNAHILFIINSFGINGILADCLRVQNGKDVDFFNVDCARTVVIDDKLIQSNHITEGIATVAGKISALIDYKINSALTGREENALLVENVEEAIDLLMEQNILDKEKRKADILYASFLVEFGRFIDGGIMYTNSSAIACALAVGGTTIETGLGEFFSAKSVIDCYVNAFSDAGKGVKTVDYSQVSQNLSKLFYQDIITVSKDILEKLSILDESCGGVEQLEKAMKNTVLRAKKEFNTLEQLYRAYGGKKSYCPKRILECAKLSGYVGKGVNGMTLYSEWGY